MPFRPARGQRQLRVEPIQSLNRRLFIEAKHSRMLRRIQVQTDDVSRLGLKIRIVAGHIPFQSVGFQLGLGQNSLHRGLAERQLLGQFPAGPVRAAVRRLLLRSPDHAGLHLRRCGTWLAALMTAFQARQSVSFEAIFQRATVGKLVFRFLAIWRYVVPSAKARMSRARKTSPAGRVHDCAQRCESSLCSGISLSKSRLSVIPDRRSKHDYVITGTLHWSMCPRYTHNSGTGGYWANGRQLFPKRRNGGPPGLRIQGTQAYT